MSGSKGKGCLKGCGCALLIIVLIIGVLIGGGVYFVKKSIYTTPDKIVSTSRELCSYSLPEAFTPVLGMDLKLMKAAAFRAGSESAPQAVVVFTEFSIGEANQSAMQAYKESVLGEIFKGVVITKQETTDLEPLTAADGTEMRRTDRVVKIKDVENPYHIYELDYNRNSDMVSVMFFVLDPDMQATADTFISTLAPAAAAQE